MAWQSITIYTTLLPILATVLKLYLAFIICDRKKLFACLKEVFYKSHYIKSYTKQQAGNQEKQNQNYLTNQKNPNYKPNQWGYSTGKDITSAPVMSWSVHLGVDPKNFSCEPGIQLSEVPMGYYNPQYNSTCNKAELILGFQNHLAIL